MRKSGRMFPKDIGMEIDEQLHMISMIASDILESCSMKNQLDLNISLNEFPSCVNKIQEIQERTKRLSMFIRKRLRNTDFMI